MCEPFVAVIAPNFPPKIGGIESFVAGLAGSAWPRSTTVVAPPAPGGPAWDAAAPFRVERRELIAPTPPRWVRAAPVINRLEKQADVLLCAEWWPAARAVAVTKRRAESRQNRNPLRVLLVHGTEIVTARGRAGSAMQKAVRSMDLLIANSAYTAAQVVNRVPGCPPVEILNPGVDTDPPRASLAAVREHLRLGPGPVVLTAARLVARKGHVEFAAHWPYVESRVRGAQWVVTGAGPCAAELRRVAGPSVHLVGAVDTATLMALYAIADVHILPGLPSAEVEGFGMAIVEAGAAGTPSVASDLGGTGEALRDGGVLTPGGDMAAMAKAIVDLLEDGSRRELLGRLARRRAEELRWDAVGARFRRMVVERVAGS